MTDTITLPRAEAKELLRALRVFDAGAMIKAEEMLITALAQQAEQASCEWKQDPDYECGDTYHSSCGELWSFIDGGPKENRVSYCHHCGKPVKMASAQNGGV